MAATRATSVLLCGCLDGLWAWFDASVGALSGHPKSVTLNGRTYRLTLLGEGGFSYVFAAEEIGTGRKFAIKRMTCQDEATVKEAVREAELYRLFSHPNIIAIEDSCVLPSGSQETGSVAKDVYMVLPLHRRGSVLDIITAKQAAQNGHPFVLSEAEVVRITRGLCAAVAQLHHFKPPGPSSVETPLAHRDIKPGNILMAHDGTPILMDFGSVAKARIQVKTHVQAVALTDLAAERCTMPYRAPELFNVESDSVLDERIDIWSIGCTTYAIAYGISPFERQSAGGSLALAIANGKFTYPNDAPYTKRLQTFIEYCLCLDKSHRPFIDEAIQKLNSLYPPSGGIDADDDV